MWLRRSIAGVCGVALAVSLTAGVPAVCSADTNTHLAVGTAGLAKTVMPAKKKKAKKATPKVTISAPGVVKVGSIATITGKVTVKGKPVKKAKVMVYRSVEKDAWKKIATIKTNSQGKYTIKSKINKQTTNAWAWFDAGGYRFKVKVAATKTTKAKTSAIKTVKRQPYISEGPTCENGGMRWRVADPDMVGYVAHHMMMAAGGWLFEDDFGWETGNLPFSTPLPDGVPCKVWLTFKKP
jgi:5-hydroxyisourate hydrolase-like protein (transthyretin family)